MLVSTIAALSMMPVVAINQVNGKCHFEIGSKTWDSNLKATKSSSGRITIRLSDVPSPEGYSMKFGCFVNTPTLSAFILAEGNGVSSLFELAGSTLQRSGSISYWDGKRIEFEQKIDSVGGKPFVRQSYKGSFPEGNKNQSITISDFSETYTISGQKQLNFQGSRSVTIDNAQRKLRASGSITSSKAMKIPNGYTFKCSNIKSSYNENTKEVVYELDATFTAGKGGGRRNRRDP